ncbi:carbon-nitrogen family hydrolase [Bacillus sp. Marseille-P3661]|uniref:carbon-nitrogen family hydrolase n=1 Tax=Bacillus sp. Marseille-P3661 TaxID=1936234 RepID=UPI000C8239AF|nr:carbon-nitrogen family hydrolase [Bacillus sp. Marseille-P3661]
MREIKISILQFDILFGNPEGNYNKVEKLINEAVKSKPDIILLPELWTTAYDLERLEEIADDKGAKTISFISSLSKKHHVNIIAGSVANIVQNGVKNTMFIVNSNGELVHDYSKVHLFRLMNEEKYLIPGNKKGAFELLGIPCAGFICYDIRFPEWIRTHAIEGSKLIFVSAEWPLARIEHWKNLLVSRAIENQCYVVACNRVGEDPNNVFGGHSIVIDPWGKVIAEGGLDETILTTTIDISLVDEVRTRIPIFEDRRTDLY